MSMTNDDLNRSLGRLEGEVLAMKDRFDRFEQLLERIDSRLMKLENLENQRKGGFYVLAIAAATIGAVVSWVITLVSKWH